VGKIIDMVNQNVQDALKKFQDTTNKEHERTQKQIKELREDLSKHQSETKDTIKKRDIQIKDDEVKKYKRRVEQRYGKPQKKESNRNSWK
jgi:microcompartment protein CcmL/EutN